MLNVEWRTIGTRRLLPLAFLVAACHDAPSAPPATGQLRVPLYGLPAGASPSLALAVAGQAARPLTAADTTGALSIGTYTLLAADVVVNGSRYIASPGSQTVSVIAASPTTATVIVYTLATGRLAVSVSGLPGGAPANATLTGDAGFTRAITGSAAVDLLAPGEYSLTARDVVASGVTYHPYPATGTVTVRRSEQAVPLAVAYSSGSATLQLAISGLPASLAAAVTVVAPNGVGKTIDASGDVSFLDPGTYNVAAHVIGSDLTTYTPVQPTQSIDIAAGGVASVSVAFTATPLALGLERVASGLAAPVFLAAPAGDSRLFIVERDGRVLLVKNGALQSTPFLDMRSSVNSTDERGLLGLAFDPHFAANGLFYVYYVDVFGQMALDRYAAEPGADVVTSLGTSVIRIEHGGSEHHGGMIDFGPDGMLYLAPGDGGCCGDPNNHAQDPGSSLGKILRIDVRSLPYRVPPDNPFVGQAGKIPEIWATGLRNPWRFAFDATANALFVADVGQDQREEVDAVSASAAAVNYGWRLMEGTACYNSSTSCATGKSLTLPVIEYTHQSGCSVIGGFPYRGARIPELAGHYLYADFCGGWVRSFRFVGNGAVDQQAWPALHSNHPVSFGRDGSGELYLIGSGTVWRIIRQ